MIGTVLSGRYRLEAKLGSAFAAWPESEVPAPRACGTTTGQRTVNAQACPNTCSTTAEAGPTDLVICEGSDLPVSHFRGRSVAAADSFFFVDQETPVWQAKQLIIDPVLLGLEHLRSLKWACWSERLGDDAVEDVFWNNAAHLLSIS